MKTSITLNQLSELLKRGYDYNQIILLKHIDEGIDVSEYVNSSLQMGAIYSSIKRKALILEKGDKLTTIGKELLIFCDSKDSLKLPKKVKNTTEFDEWWKEYPGTTNFMYKNKVFQGDRSLRVGKEECKTKFSKILIQGEYTASDLIEALKYEVIQKKESSLKTGTNKLTYMQNSLTYLNQLTFIPYVELIKEGNKIEISNNSPITNGTDI